MINIRSITYNLPSKNYFSTKMFSKIDKNMSEWDLKNIFIRTKRASFPILAKPISLNDLKKFQRLCNIYDIRWFDIPLDPWTNDDKIYNYAYKVLKEVDQAFINILCVKDNQFSVDYLENSIKLMKKISKIDDNGKTNFRLGLSLNIKENCPFFPFSVSSGEGLTFSIALELTQEINKVVAQNRDEDLKTIRDKILDTLVPQIEKLNKYAEDISNISGIRFVGFDFSLAPIIGINGSIISILKNLGFTNFGDNGTMFATYYLTNILKYLASKFKSVGFSGVMYSLLEDIELCSLNNTSNVKLEDLIKLATMCGCGIDMVPVTSDTSDAQIINAILDVAAISMRYDKPLGIRILPIPRTYSNSTYYTNFTEDADFISNTRVLTISSNLNEKDKLTNFEILPLK